jgi:cytochrome P450
MDSSTEFLFGISAGTQECGMVREGKMQPTEMTVSMDGFEGAFRRVQKHVGVRMKVGKSYWMIDGPSYRLACHDLVTIKNRYLHGAIAHAKICLAENDNEPKNVIQALVVEGHDFDYIANQCRHLIIAGFETTSALLGFSFGLIERHEEVFRKLRETVVEKFGTERNPLEPLTFESLKDCKYLQYVIMETLRLFPAGPSIQRVAVRDTILPRGGGEDGMGPIAVPKGATIQLGIYLCHKRKDLWGEGVNDFKPERWEGRKKGYDFIPFIAGPQICLGQQYSIAQVAFCLVKFLMRFDRMEKPIGADNLRKGWQTVLAPGNGVQLRLHYA